MPRTDFAARIPALAEGGAAVVTGAASGIGLAAAKAFAQMGMKVVLADLAGERLTAAGEAVQAAGEAEVLVTPTDVSRPEDLQRLAEQVEAEFGPPAVLMNNAGVGLNPGSVGANLDQWRQLMDINFWGVVHGVQAFWRQMTVDDRPRLIINTGSKQGITTPPGNAAYNVSKAALKAYTEATAHELRNLEGVNTTAHLLIPGFTFTGISRQAEKPPGAWTADQVVDFMLERLSKHDFYILCPDNDVDRATDEKRMRWAADDVIQNRPALSRWHPDYKAAFEDYMKS